MNTSHKFGGRRRHSRNEISPQQLDGLKRDFRRMVETNLEPLPEEPNFATCDDTLSRFLIARNYVLNDAYKQLAAAVEWRRYYKPVTATCSWCSETPGFHSIRQIGFDRDGHPILYASFVQCQTTKNTAEDIIAHMVYLLENGEKCTNYTRVSFVIIIDCTGFTLSSCNPKIGKKFIQTFSDYYPERLYRFILLHHNSFFHGIWKAIKVFIDPITVKKVKLLKTNKIQQAFEEYFDRETSNWLLQEIVLNKNNISEIQLKFWEDPNEQSSSSIHHDPRGTNTYIKHFIEPLSEFVKKHPQISLTTKSLGINTHLPHPSILDRLEGKLQNIHVTVMNTTKTKPNPTELQLYGINPDETLEDFSDQESDD